MKLKIILFMILGINILSADYILEDLDGWDRMAEPLTYQQDNLWEYINGAADLFLSYGFVELESHEFTNNTISFSLDIYDMDIPINAFGVYMTEISKDASTIKIGTEAVVIPPYQCLYLKDKYYIKINVFEGLLTREQGIEILENLDSKITGSSEYPQEFKNLPTENLIEGSYRFVRESYLGLRELSECIIASYKNETGENYESFLVLTKNEDGAKKMIMALPEKWENSSDSARDIYYRKIPYKGYVGLIVLKNKKLFGISGLKELGTLKQILLK